MVVQDLGQALLFGQTSCILLPSHQHGYCRLAALHQSSFEDTMWLVGHSLVENGQLS